MSKIREKTLCNGAIIQDARAVEMGVKFHNQCSYFRLIYSTRHENVWIEPINDLIKPERFEQYAELLQLAIKAAKEAEEFLNEKTCTK